MTKAMKKKPAEKRRVKQPLWRPTMGFNNGAEFFVTYPGTKLCALQVEVYTRNALGYGRATILIDAADGLFTVFRKEYSLKANPSMNELKRTALANLLRINRLLYLTAHTKIVRAEQALQLDIQKAADKAAKEKQAKLTLNARMLSVARKARKSP